MPRFAYAPRVVTVTLGAEKTTALTFVANRMHESFAGRLNLEQVARTIAECSGARGPNADYLFNTLRHLEALGVREPGLDLLRHAVQSLQLPRELE